MQNAKHCAFENEYEETIRATEKLREDTGNTDKVLSKYIPNSFLEFFWQNFVLFMQS